MRIILDSSVIAKWYIKDEELMDYALNIREDFIRGELDIHAPIIIDYEINNILNMSLKRARISKRLAVNALKSFYLLDIIKYFPEDKMIDTFKIAIKQNLSSYDASYILLNKQLNIPFFTADKKLFNSVKKDFPLVRYLKDYG